MITDYVRRMDTLGRMRASCVGEYLDDYASTMAGAGFAPLTVIEHLRTVVQLARWAERRGVDVGHWDEALVASFRRHVARRGLTKRNRVVTHAAQFFEFLRARGVLAPEVPAPVPRRAPILDRFASWMVRHRGVTSHTLRRYQRVLAAFVTACGEEPASYEAAAIRTFVVGHLRRSGRGEARDAVTAIRSFLRFLVAEERMAPGIEHCVPTVPQWRLSSLPRYLEPSDVQRVVESCDLSTSHGLRDHAILLLLSRLGLRAGDIVAMMVDDIDWRRGTLRVQGKSSREALLPLPQDVGNALLTYLGRGRPK